MATDDDYMYLVLFIYMNKNRKKNIKMSSAAVPIHTQTKERPEKMQSPIPPRVLKYMFPLFGNHLIKGVDTVEMTVRKIRPWQ